MLNVKESSDSEYLMRLKDILPYSICWLNSNNGYLWCNKQYAHALGLTPEEVVGHKIDAFLPKDELSQLIDIITLAEKSKQQVQRVKVNRHSQHEQKRLTMIPILDKKPIEFVCIEESISEEQANEIKLRNRIETLEKSLQDTKFFLQRIIDSIPAFIFWKNKEGVILGDNIHHARLAGFESTAEIVGKTDYDLWSNAADQVLKNDLEVMQTQETLVFEEINEIKPNERVYYLNSKSPMLDSENKVIGTLGIALDITERKKMEIELTEAKNIAEASNHSKSEFIANMSHDIRTPISSLVILTSVLMEQVTDEESRELAHDCKVCSEQLLHLLNQILEVAELDHRISSNKTEVFEFKTLLKNIAELTGPSATIKHLQLNTSCDENIPHYVLGHKQVLYRILLNLVSNAIKFTAQGSVDISADLKSRHDDQVEIEIRVKDTGIGIPLDKQKDIFQKFSRLSRSDQSQYQGFGIGLYIVDELIKSIDGQIDVTSKPGEGATFIVTCTLLIHDKEDQAKTVEAMDSQSA